MRHGRARDGLSDSHYYKLEALTTNVPAKGKSYTAEILEMIDVLLMRDMITGGQSKLTVVALQGKARYGDHEAQLGLILSIFLQLKYRDRLIYVTNW